MPSAFTHALVRAAAAQMLPSEVPRVRVTVFCAVAASIPDADFVAFNLGIPYGEPFGHRGFSHSLLFAIVLGGLAPLLLPRGWRLNSRRVVAVAVIGMAAVASHGLLDAATDAGLGIGFFLPISDARFFFPFRPLETASMDPLRFFSGRGLEVLSSEVVWVWIPLIVISSLHQLLRRMRAHLSTQGKPP